MLKKKAFSQVFLRSGAYRRVCDDASASTDMTVDTLAAAGPDIVFRTNRTRIILNSTGSGAVWLPDENMVLMDDWDEVDKQLTEQENLEDSPDTTDEIADPEISQDSRSVSWYRCVAKQYPRPGKGQYC